MALSAEVIVDKLRTDPMALTDREKWAAAMAIFDSIKDLKEEEIKTREKEVRATFEAACWLARQPVLDLFKAINNNPVLVKAMQDRIEESWNKFNEGHQEMAGILTLGEVGLRKSPLEQVQQIYDGENAFSAEQRRMVAITWGKRLLRGGLEGEDAARLISYIVDHPRDGVKPGTPDIEAAIELAVPAFEGATNPTKPYQKTLFTGLEPAKTLVREKPAMQQRLLL